MADAAAFRIRCFLTLFLSVLLSCDVVLAQEIAHEEKIVRRERISDRIADAMKEIFKKRVIVGFSGTGILQQALTKQENRPFSAEGSMDVFFIYRPFDFTTFFLDLETIGGNGPDEFFNSLSGLNDDAGDFRKDNGFDRLSVREAWLELKFFDKQISLVIGKVDLTNYFDNNAIANDETTQFITSAFVNNLTLEAPKNGPGILSIYEMENGLHFRLGLQSSDNGEFDAKGGLYGIGEIGIHSRFPFGLEGNHRLWARINGGNEDNKGAGVSLDQQLSTRLFAFARYGINETDGADVKMAWSAGLELHSPFSSRTKDSTAFAFGRTEAVDGNKESAAEIYYRIALNEHIAITPLFQTVFDSAGPEDHDTVSLIGIRTQIEF